MKFYDDIADRYDEVTGAAGRVEPAAAFVKELASRHPIASAVDAACGTGLYAVQLARAGVRAVGADISAGMLQAARRCADAAGAEVAWVHAPMQELADRVTDPHDAVLCMGNSLPHLLTDEDLAAAMDSFRRMLRDGGLLAVQILNYHSILADRERIVGVNRSGRRLYVRFYDFLAELVRFNILVVDLSLDRPGHALHSTTLRPYTHDQLAGALGRHGFDDVQAFGDLQFGPFDPQTSDMLLITARATA